MELPDDLERAITGWAAHGIELRRHLHRHPEVAFHETATRATVVDYLADIGVTRVLPAGTTGVVAVIEGAGPGDGALIDVALRAELDALPVPDESGASYASTVHGTSHACGHDAHLAALLVTARVLMQVRHQWAGRVVLLVQPAEESPPGGALDLLSLGELGPSTAVYGAHLASDLPCGRVEVTTGPVQSANDRFTIHVQGVGGHAATPESANDALLAASTLVVALQSVVSRAVPPLEAAVVSVGMMRSGEVFNAIADRAVLEGTARTYSPEIRDVVRNAVRRVVASVPAAFGCSGKLIWTAGYPAVVNDGPTARHTLQTLDAALPGGAVTARRPRMESDDFAYYLEKHPGNFFFIGSGGDTAATRYPHHHPRFDIDERAIETIVRSYLALVLADPLRAR